MRFRTLRPVGVMAALFLLIVGTAWAAGDRDRNHNGGVQHGGGAARSAGGSAHSSGAAAHSGGGSLRSSNHSTSNGAGLGTRGAGVRAGGSGIGGHTGNVAGRNSNHSGNAAGRTGIGAGFGGNRAARGADGSGAHSGHGAGLAGNHGAGGAGLAGHHGAGGAGSNGIHAANGAGRGVRTGDVEWHRGNHGGNLAGHNGNRGGDAMGRHGDNPRPNWHNRVNGDLFSNGWWNHQAPARGWWHPGLAWANQSSLWGLPTWAGLSSWYGGSSWANPLNYDYGPGGSLAFQDDGVYLNGTNFGSVAEFGQSAALLAAVDPPSDEAALANTEWLPLGVFAVSTSKQEADSSVILQLAVSKEGIVSGLLYDTAADKSEIVQGQMDSRTQRVAFRVGDEDLVAEAGAYNLTQPEAGMLVHFGRDRLERFQLRRLDRPTEDEIGQTE
jgi:hypothetical protein